MRPTVEGKDVSDREPYYDVIEAEEEITVTVELPGVQRHEIYLRATERSLAIDVNSSRRYWKLLELSEPIDSESLRWTFNNGVLDIALRKRVRHVKVD